MLYDGPESEDLNFSAKHFTTNNANTSFYSSFKILKEANKFKRQVLVSSFKDIEEISESYR